MGEVPLPVIQNFLYPLFYEPAKAGLDILIVESAPINIDYQMCNMYYATRFNFDL